MSDIAIKINGLGKRFRIGVEEERHDTFGGVLISWLNSPVRNFRRLKSLSRFREGEQGDDIVWALKDISFEVSRGEVVGLIGRNGAGKSTLLKILSRITEPTSGYADLHGRVSSLLEVGTGFHPELTGRENVYLNGTILGMSKAEIDEKFDEIVAFAEVEKFIDTPIKRYSTGMRVRLAFAVSAHLEPEILLIDEVLAVGDLGFQKKCLGRMEKVAHEGRTVVFVSHNMAMIQSLCTRVILLENGGVVYDGPTELAVNKYIEMAEDKTRKSSLAEREDREGGDVFRFQEVDFLNPETMEPLGIVLSGKPVLIRVKYSSLAKAVFDRVHIAIDFFNSSGVYVFECSNEALGKLLEVPPGQSETYCLIPKFPLNHGRYHYDVFARRGRGNRLDYVREAGFFDVEVGDFYGTGAQPGFSTRQGVFVEFDWLEQVQVTVNS